MIYKKFAGLYDLLMYDFPYEKAGDFIFQILGEGKIEVLDMACGTGTFTKILGEKYVMTGFDLSEEMLALAQNKNPRNRFFKQDLKNFKAPGTYDAAICMCDSINYLLKEEEVKSSFKSVYGCLKKGGCFIFDANTKEKFQKMENTYVDERENSFYIWENYYDKEKTINSYVVNFFVEKDNGLYERFTEEHFERAYEGDFFIKTLEEFGFEDIKIYKAYEFSENLEGADRLLFVAKKL
ncbi:class I SAM-dependent DNA methyltransferase [Peptoniphilus raoultii]|uniref:class I SAM-dependent DNA methyltransferase n=1 Tax=Peptoniphilus raoultii TaxID=1776387 RepID=UPI0008DABC31|nr:class I SAM-dependent methyltransferase [Peptoniphilus raoultii]